MTTAKLTAALIAAALAVSALAADEQTGELPYIPYGNLSGATAEGLERARALGESVADALLKAQRERATPQMARTAQRAKDRMDAIADETMSKERDQILEFLGIDPQATTGLYIFVSWSMPVELLRSYVVEAMWSGATVVFRGVPPGKQPIEFIGGDLKHLVYGKGASANMSIDPRLFDVFDVRSVPAIVFSKVRGDLQCRGVSPVPFRYNGKELSYDGCPELPEDSYIKMTGAVTTSYALQTFIEDYGESGARPYLDALAKGWATGKTPAKNQVSFRGDWEEVMTPEEAANARKLAEMLLQNPLPAKEPVE